MGSHIRRWAAGIVLGGTLAFAPSMVSADSLTPLPGAPSVDITSVPASIQPQFTYVGGDGSYSVGVTVATNATLSVLETVKMCWYKGTAIGESPWTGCPIVGPEDGFEMVWTEAADAFTVSAGTKYAEDGSSIVGDNGYDDSAQTMDMMFTFKVSNAMLAGSDWNVRVTATYDAAGSYPDASGFDEESGKTVEYWGQITTEREAAEFGFVAEGGTAFDTVSAGAWVANAPSDFTLRGTDFTNGSVPADTLILRSAAGAPGTGEVALDCEVDDDAAESVRIPKIIDVRAGADVGPSGEAPVTTTMMFCTLTYGGGAAKALTEYSNTVTIGIVELS